MFRSDCAGLVGTSVWSTPLLERKACFTFSSQLVRETSAEWQGKRDAPRTQPEAQQAASRTVRACRRRDSPLLATGEQAELRPATWPTLESRRKGVRCSCARFGRRDRPGRVHPSETFETSGRFRPGKCTLRKLHSDGIGHLWCTNLIEFRKRPDELVNASLLISSGRTIHECRLVLIAV